MKIFTYQQMSKTAIFHHIPPPPSPTPHNYSITSAPKPTLFHHLLNFSQVANNPSSSSLHHSSAFQAGISQIQSLADSSIQHFYTSSNFSRHRHQLKKLLPSQ
jgi:hypothetical protein